MTNYNELLDTTAAPKLYLHSGPNGRRHHNKKLLSDRYIGNQTPCLETSLNLDYLWRSPQGRFTPKPKYSNVGEIGWAHNLSSYINRVHSPIKYGFARQEVENRVSHRLQEAWYPGPNDKLYTEEPQYMNVYETYVYGRKTAQPDNLPHYAQPIIKRAIPEATSRGTSIATTHSNRPSLVRRPTSPGGFGSRTNSRGAPLTPLVHLTNLTRQNTAHPSI